MSVSLLTLLLLSLFGIHRTDSKTNTAPQWSMDLNLYGYRSFEEQDLRLWTRQQGVRFLTNEALVVYQVQRSENQTELKKRNPSGGGGSFRLKLSIFDVHSGKALKQMDIPASSEAASVIPTHDGSFIVRTGESVALYSADFRPLKSIQLPMRHSSGQEWWDVDVAPSGKTIFLAHQLASREEGSKTELDILDGDSLESVGHLSVSHLNSWSAGDEFIASADPYRERGNGILSLDGQWTPLVIAASGCPNSIQALAFRRVADFGCNLLSVKSLDNSEQFVSQSEGSSVVSSVVNNRNILAARIDRRKADFLDNGRLLNPLRIDVFNVEEKRQLLSVPIKHLHTVYAVSASGDLGVIAANQLNVFHP